MAGLDYEFAPIDVTIMTHPKACLAGTEAMGLWLFGQTYARLHKTDGRIHRAAALAAWGGKRNLVLAKRLVEAGLWIDREDGDWDVHNFVAKAPGQRSRGGEAPKSSTERVQDFRARKKAAASANVTGETETETDETRFRNGNGSTSISSSLSVSSGGSAEGGEAPPWWDDACAASELAGCPVTDRQARWHSYAAARTRKGWAINQRDAIGWLCDVIRAERSRARDAPPKSSGGGPRGDRQGLGDVASWLPKTGTDGGGL